MQPLQMPPTFATGSTNNNSNQQMLPGTDNNSYIRGPMPPSNNYALQQMGSSTMSAFSQPTGFATPGSNFSNTISNNPLLSQVIQGGSMQPPIIPNQNNQAQSVVSDSTYRPPLIQSTQMAGPQLQQPLIRSYQPNGIQNQFNPSVNFNSSLPSQPNLTQQMSNLSLSGPNFSSQPIPLAHNQPQIQAPQYNKQNVMMPGPPISSPPQVGPMLGGPPMLTNNSAVPMMPPPTSSMMMNRATTPNSAAGQYATQPLPYNMQQQSSSYDQNQHHNSSTNRMDMDQMPNPIEVMQANNSKFGGDIFETNESGKLPPLTSTDFITKDSGNCNPRFIRSSIYSVPANPDILKQSKLPFVLNLTPFAELKNDEVS
jgi:protein transport protein SEC24